MLEFDSPNDLSKDLGGTAVTIGKFDAVHLGHQFLLHELLETAEEHDLSSVVVTFDRHPLSTLQPGSAPQAIIGQKQKRFHLAEAGVDVLMTLEFDDALANLSPEEFVKSILVDKLNAKYVIVGHGFRFGANGEGTCELLAQLAEKYSFRFKELAPFEIDSKVVSATRVRERLDAGDIAGAERLLGRSHVTTGKVEHGLKIGRTIGFPTANIARDCEGYLPLDGVYAGWMHVDGQKLPTAISIGINETFQAVPRLAEAFVLDRKDLDLYDKVVNLEYVEFIRPAAKFNGVEDLVEEINRDIAKIRVSLKLENG
jgi:riboflavin kinase/FMN adenylyltransferase